MAALGIKAHNDVPRNNNNNNKKKKKKTSTAAISLTTDICLQQRQGQLQRQCH